MDDGISSQRLERLPAIRPEHDALVRALAALPNADRRDVISAAEQVAARAQGTLSWELWEQARGVVSLGGNAVEDCDRLYDGT